MSEIDPPEMTSNERNEEVLDQLFHPVYEGIAKRIPKNITPNTITLIGFLNAVLASLVIVVSYNLAYFYLAVIHIYLWHLLDALDGCHARLTHQKSKFGAFLDLSLDSAGFGLIYFALITRFELYEPFFIGVYGLRLVLGITGFAYDAVNKTLYVPPFGITSELFTMMGFFLGIAYFPEHAAWIINAFFVVAFVVASLIYISYFFKFKEVSSVT